MLPLLTIVCALLVGPHALSRASPLAPQHAFASSPAPVEPLPIALEGYENGWYDPRKHGGSLLNRATEGGLGEPLNIIISNRSSPDVLRKHGFEAYSRSLGFWNECGNVHLSDPQYADLGDGEGWTKLEYLMRESLVPWVGSCVQSVIGGNHYRAWQQSGSLAPSRALFLAASKEVDARGNHKIVTNGYNIGRDLIVAKAIEGTTYLGRTWDATVEWLQLLPEGANGINHDIPIDGRVAVLTVREH